MSLAELRERTRPLHDRLDKRLNLFQSITNREEYREHLYRFYCMLFQVEKNIPRFPEWNGLEIHWKERAKCALLRMDLLALGCNHRLLENPESPARLPPMGTFPESVGSLYVIEGSSLGAQYISRHFGEKLGLTATSGMSFHIGYGPLTGLRWKEFCAAIEVFFICHPQSKNETLLAACAAFSAVEETLCDQKILVEVPNA